MAKSNKTIAQHFAGSKGNIFIERIQPTSLDKIMIVPIEIGKNSHKVLMSNYFGSILKEPFEFHSSEEGIGFLHNTISKVSRDHNLEKTLIAMEATGHYYKKPADRIHEIGYHNLFILNPVSTSQCRKAGLTWSKTDDVDLRAIGQALLSGYGTIYRPEKPIWAELKEICRYRRFQVKRQTALKNRTHAILDYLLPGITELQIFRDRSLWHSASLEFFTKYPTVDSITRLKPRRITEFFKRRGRRLLQKHTYELLRWSKQALNSHSLSNSVREDILKSLLLELKQISESISHIEVKLLGYLTQIPPVLLLSIDYIGPIRAGEFGGEITPFEQYPTSRALIKGAGIDSTRFQTSTYESSKHPISKKGSRSLRYIGIDIGDGLMRQNDYFRYFAKQLMDRGKSKGCACIATTTRFMRVAFWMIKDQKTFNPPNGKGVSKDPLAKIERFLHERHASDKIEEYVKFAEKYFIKGKN